MVKQGINLSKFDDDFVVNNLMRLGRDGHLSTNLEEYVNEWVVNRYFSTVDLRVGVSRLMSYFGSNKFCDSFSFSSLDVRLGSTVWVSIRTQSQSIVVCVSDLESSFNMSDEFWNYKVEDKHNIMFTEIDSGQVLLVGDNSDSIGDGVCLVGVGETMTVVRCGSDMVSI